MHQPRNYSAHRRGSAPIAAYLVIATALASSAECAHAVDIAPGDYAVPPPGTNLVLFYGQYRTSRVLTIDRAGEIPDSELDSNVNLLRLVHYGETRGVPFAVQTIIPFGSFTAARRAGVEQETANGFGDVVLAASIFPIHSSDPHYGTTVGFSMFLSLPTGAHQPSALSLGSDTTTTTLQLGVIQGLAHGFAFDGAIDVALVANHREAGLTHSQDPYVQAQVYARYALTPRSTVSVGYAATFGGKQYVDRVYQGLSSEAHQLRLFTNNFVTPTWQLQLMAGRDLSRPHGFEDELVTQFRVLKMF